MDYKSKQSPLVSIRCLVYNHEPYLRQCLDGFVMQKTDFAFVAIVHDDASTDGSAAIIQEYADKYPDIIKPIFETENQYSKRDGSLSKIMDNAIHPDAKYIAFCEGDDYWIDASKLQKQVNYMESHPECMLCGSNGLILTEKGLMRPAYFNQDFTSRIIDIKEIIGHWHFPTCSLIYRKSMNENYPEWTSQIYSGDQTRTLLAGIKGSIYSIGETTCVYRKMPENPYSLTNITQKNRLFEITEHIKLYTYFREEVPKDYYNIITEHINCLKKERDYILLKKQFILKPFFIMPLFSFRKLLFRNIPSYIKQCIHKYLSIDILKQGQYN